MKPKPQLEGLLQKIVAFHLDERLDWVADLECGHQQQVRHNPPWRGHHWVTTTEGRKAHIGHELPCVACSSMGVANRDPWGAKKMPALPQNEKEESFEEESLDWKFKIVSKAFLELFELLQEYAPVWFTNEHYNRALAAYRILQKSRGAAV